MAPTAATATTNKGMKILETKVLLEKRISFAKTKHDDDDSTLGDDHDDEDSSLGHGGASSQNSAGVVDDDPYGVLAKQHLDSSSDESSYWSSSDNDDDDNDSESDDYENNEDEEDDVEEEEEEEVEENQNEDENSASSLHLADPVNIHKNKMLDISHGDASADKTAAPKKATRRRRDRVKRNDSNLSIDALIKLQSQLGDKPTKATGSPTKQNEMPVATTTAVAPPTAPRTTPTSPSARRRGRRLNNKEHVTFLGALAKKIGSSRTGNDIIMDKRVKEAVSKMRQSAEKATKLPYQPQKMLHIQQPSHDSTTTTTTPTKSPSSRRSHHVNHASSMMMDRSSKSHTAGVTRSPSAAAAAAAAAGANCILCSWPFLRLRFFPLLLLLLGQQVKFCRGIHTDYVIDHEDAVMISVLWDIKGTPGVEELSQFTVQLLNNHSDGWFDDVLPSNTELRYTLTDVACEEDMAVRAYLKLTQPVYDNFTGPPHAIVGCRCSGPTRDVARLASVENIPIVSGTATSSKLSDRVAFSTFARLVAPDDEMGQVGALVKLMRAFGWDRMSIITTDSSYTNDFELELFSAWKGEHEGPDPFTGNIGFSGRIRIDQSTGKVAEGSVRHVLEQVPVENPSINSKVIVLLAHHQHAFDILKIAKEKNFQPDTIWISVDGWTSRHPLDLDVSWMPDIPGYIGLLPHRDTQAPVYLDFLRRLQEDQRRHNRTVMTNLADYAADRIVDSILALAMALANVEPEQRRNGTAVVAALRDLKFVGVSGPVGFTETGGWAYPLYTVMTLPRRGSDWIEIGTVSPEEANIDLRKICYAEIGCVHYIPDGVYPVPLPSWSIPLISLTCIVTVFLCLGSVYLEQSRRQRQTTKEQLRLALEEIKQLDYHSSAAGQRKARLYQDVAKLLGEPRPSHWSDGEGLVQIDQTDKEYWDIHNRFNATTNGNQTFWISQLSRVQNVGLHSYCVFRKNQMANKYGLDLHEIEEALVWHGTSSLNPNVIYKDTHEGFMLQYSQEGLYGQGLYFAKRSGYSDHFAYRVNNGLANSQEDSDDRREERELFLVKLIVGKAITLDHNEAPEACGCLRTPPDNPDEGGLKYDTVIGEADPENPSKIYVVYENGRAYPQYLVRYYKGARDPSLTKFASYKEAIGQVEDAGTLATTNSHGSGYGSSSIGDITPEESETRSQFDSSTPLQSAVDNSGESETRSQVDLSTPVQSADDNTQESIDALVPGDVEAGAPITTLPFALSADAIWMFQGDDGYSGDWVPYGEDAQAELETAFVRDPGGRVTIEIDPWTYEIDFAASTQTNLQHPSRRVRKIKRVAFD